MAEPARKLWTLDEFLAFDDGTDTRYELIAGEIVAMAPPADVHSRLAGRLGMTIGAKLRRPCEVAIEAGILLPDRADTYYQADLAVTCARATGERFVAEPQVIVEILSLTTADMDYLRKLPDYRDIPSVQDILLVSSSEPRVEHWRREADGWKVRLQAFDITIAVAELYQDLLPAEEAQAAD
jgi:Uma2 family endonuclease